MESIQPSPKPPSRARRLLIGLVVIFVALASELLLRSVGVGKPTLIQPDQAAGYILEPHQSLYRFGHHVITNSFGMRSDEVPASKPAGVFRLLIVGDSYAYGTVFVDQANIFPELLQKELPAQIHQPVSVLNASAGGWAISNEVGYVRSRGLFDSDLVLLVLNQGDPAQPFAAYKDQYDSTYSVEHHPRLALQEIWDHYVRKRLFPRQIAPSQLPTPSQEQQTETENLGYLDQLLKITRAARTPLAVAYVSAPNYPQSPTRLIAWCADNQVPMINLAPVSQHWPFAEVMNSDHAHFNTKGNRLVANELEKEWSTVMPAAGSRAQGGHP